VICRVEQKLMAGISGNEIELSLSLSAYTGNTEELLVAYDKLNIFVYYEVNLKKYR